MEQAAIYSVPIASLGKTAPANRLILTDMAGSYLHIASLGEDRSCKQ